jgi:TonB family protein
MLNQEQQRERTTWTISHLVSVALHCLVLWVLFWIAPRTAFVKPSSIKKGDRGTATLVYLAPKGPTQEIAVASRKNALIFLKAARVKKQREHSFKPQPPEKPRETEIAAATAGSPYGSVSDGLTTGADVRPAIPTLFPDPPNLRSGVPYGVQGDVVVEVTIDAQGNVIETRLLKTIGYGVEEKVMETVRNWHFRPATRDGVAIPSKHDVLYHFPS